MRNKYFYPIFKLKTKSWIRYWLLKKTEFKGKLSDILTGFSFNLQNTLRQKFVKFEIEGNSIQDGEPSPENEVPILSSGDNGSITEKIVNKNLAKLNQSLNTDRSAWTYTSETPENITASKTDTGGKFLAVFEANIIKGQSYILKGQQNTGGIYAYSDRIWGTTLFTANLNGGKTFTASYTGKLIIGAYTSYTSEVSVQNLQLELGSTATDYVAHEEQTYSIPVQAPFRSIGDVRDVFFKNTVDSPYYDENLVENGWYERHDIPRKIFDGTENWQVNGHVFYLQIADKIQQKLEVLSNNYRYSTMDWSNMNNYEISTQNNTFIFIRDDNYSTRAEFNTLLAKKYANGHPLYIDYLAQEPLNLPCTQSQIDILENIPITYEGQTNVYSIDEVQAYLKIQYWESDENG